VAFRRITDRLRGNTNNTTPHLPEDQALQLARKRTNVTPTELQQLAQHPSPAVRAQVARNRLTPPDALTTLAADKDPEVQRVICYNPNRPTEADLTLTKTGNLKIHKILADTTTNQEALLLLAKSNDEDVAINTAHNPNTLTYALIGLLNSPHELARWYAGEQLKDRNVPGYETNPIRKPEWMD